MKRISLVLLMLLSFCGMALAYAADNSTTMKQSTTPAAPAKLSDNLYFKSDDNLYSQTSTGSEKLFLQSPLQQNVDGDGHSLFNTTVYATGAQVVNDVATNATVYPLWVTASSGNLPLKVSSTGLSFNPSTGILSLAGGINIGNTGFGKITPRADSTTAVQITNAAGTALMNFNTTSSITTNNGELDIVGPSYSYAIKTPISGYIGDGSRFISWFGGVAPDYNQISLNSYGGVALTTYGSGGYGTYAPFTVLGNVGANTGSVNVNAGSSLMIPDIKSTTGQRFVCVSSTGQIVSSTTACVGT